MEKNDYQQVENMSNVSDDLTFIDFTPAITCVIMPNNVTKFQTEIVEDQLFVRRHTTIIRTICNKAEESIHPYKNCLNGHIKDLHIDYSKQRIMLGIDIDKLPKDFIPFVPKREVDDKITDVINWVTSSVAQLSMSSI